MRLPHSAGSDEQQPDFLGRVILDELLGDFEGVLVGLVVDLEILQGALLVPARDAGRLDEHLLLPLDAAFTAPGHGTPPSSRRIQPIPWQTGHGARSVNSGTPGAAGACGIG